MRELAEHTRQRLFRWVLLGCAIVGAALVLPGGGLKTAQAPAGMMSLELNFGRLPEMLASYNAQELQICAFQIGLDYLFMALYPLGMILGILGTLRKRGDVPGWFNRIAFALVVAGFCDGIENVFLIHALTSGASAAHGWCATVFSGVKFGILAVGFAIWIFAARKPARSC